MNLAKRSSVIVIAMIMLGLAACKESRDGAVKKQETPSAPPTTSQPGHFPAFTDQVLAVVGPEQITRKALELEAVNRRYSSYRQRSAEEAYQRALENLMGMRLLYLGAVDEGYLRGTALAREIEVTKKIWLAGIYITEKLPERVTVTAKDFGDDVPESFDAVDASMIVFPSREEAEDAWAKISSGALKFEKAAERSIRPTREPGGRIGEIRRNSSYFTDRKQVKTIFGLSVGQMTSPFEGPLGWTIVRVNKKRDLSKQEIDSILLSARNKVIPGKVEAAKAEIAKRHRVDLFPGKLKGAAPDTTVAVLGKEKYSLLDFQTFRKTYEGQWTDPGSGDREKMLRLFGSHLAWAEEAREKGIDNEADVKERMKLFTVERTSNEVRNRLESGIKVSDDEAREYFKKKSDKYRGEDQAWIKTVFVNDEKIGAEVKSRAEKGEDFDSLMREFSVEKGKGEYGPITPKMIPGEFGVEVFSMREGDVSRVVKVGERFIVAKMIRFTKADKPVFAKVKNQVIADLRNEKVSPTVYGRLDELKKRYIPVVNEEGFRKFLKEKTKSPGGPR